MRILRSETSLRQIQKLQQQIFLLSLQIICSSTESVPNQFQICLHQLKKLKNINTKNRTDLEGIINKSPSATLHQVLETRSTMKRTPTHLTKEPTFDTPHELFPIQRNDPDMKSIASLLRRLWNLPDIGIFLLSLFFLDLAVCPREAERN